MTEPRKYYGIIYKATFPNGKMYVGQTTRELQVRIAQHIGTRNSENFPFHRAIKKYGKENIKWEIIDYGKSKDDLNEKERYWIKELRTYTGFRNSQGYNADLGGGRHEVFGPLDDIELEEFGKDYFSGMSKNDLHNKYNKNGKLNRHLFFEILNGKQWGSYTKIPRRDFSIEPMRSPFTPIQVDKILERFKECGNTRTIADEYGVKVRLITDIVKGHNWGKYTGITDDSFYNKYVRLSKILTNEELLDIVEMGTKEHKTAPQIQEKYPSISKSFIRNLCTGKTLSDFTGIDPLSIQIKQELSGKKSCKLEKEDINKILFLNTQKISAVKIAKEIGCSPSTVDNVLSGNSWSSYTKITKESSKSLSKLLSKDIVLKIRKDRQNGLTFRELANKYDTYTSVICGICNGDTYKKYTNGIPVTKGIKNDNQ